MYRRSKMNAMKKSIPIAMVIGLVMLTGCATIPPETGEAQAEEVEVGTNTANSSTPVTTPDGDEVGESILERATDGITMKFDFCCVLLGNAYTAWWLIGDVELPMSSVKSMLATGFVADSEALDLELTLGAGPDGISDPYDGIRIALLDHGPDTGDSLQLTIPNGGCWPVMCPVVFRTSHAAP